MSGHVTEMEELTKTKIVTAGENKREDSKLLYRIDDNPPWILCVVLGFQHYLTAFGSTLTVPLVLVGPLCIGQNNVALSELIATTFFVSGLATILQTTFGIRLPIIQGPTFAFLPPIISVLSSSEWTCPENITAIQQACQSRSNNLTSLCDESVNDIWKLRMREIQGAICVASLFQVFVGCSGLIAAILRFIGPLTVTPTIALIGLSLFEVAADKASSHWWIAIVTMVLVALFSQYLKHIKVPLPLCEKGGECTVIRLPIFQMLPVLLAMLLSWLLCLVLTSAGALPDGPGDWGYRARTDIRTQVLHDSPWFRVPYPGQWGMPTVGASAALGMLAGVIASMLESVGDYYACANLAGAPTPPPHALNRGVAMEGLSCILAGLVGSGNGTTSYSENVGAVGLTRVGSRRVVFTAGLLLMVLGMLGKTGALFVTIPDPVVGGMFMSMFGMIFAVGLSNLRHVDLTSPRNLFVLATSMFTGLALPHWVVRHPGAITLGEPVVDQILTVLLSTSMFVGGVIGFALDISIPGTDEERGIISWRQENSGESDADESMDENYKSDIYGIPFVQGLINRSGWYRYVPIFGNTQPQNQCATTTGQMGKGLEERKIGDML